ncbi:DUF4145 domain-containing protein [Xanthobacter versatilis]|uniref:hypothetical protein n=1 Tax=Xanthobacter autotrophicus (strain ATCC BAA-1158 / Py2) TaxID=78245 RepID=UPI00372C4285
MFRSAIDLTTKDLLPAEDTAGLNGRTRRDLGLRLPWLISNGKLAADLAGLSTCIREDGNDGVHAANLSEPDAEDLYDFAFALLERLYTEPARIAEAERRREERRGRQRK